MTVPPYQTGGDTLGSLVEFEELKSLCIPRHLLKSDERMVENLPPSLVNLAVDIHYVEDQEEGLKEVMEVVEKGEGLKRVLVQGLRVGRKRIEELREVCTKNGVELTTCGFAACFHF